MIQRAFALGGNEEEEFQSEKDAEVQKEIQELEDSTTTMMPGWGTASFQCYIYFENLIIQVVGVEKVQNHDLNSRNESRPRLMQRFEISRPNGKRARAT